MVAFRNIGHWGNCIYVDNVNIGNGPLSVSQHSVTSQPFIYPVPAVAGACMHIRLPVGTYTITLYDASGKKLKSEKTEGIGSLDIPENLSPGTYLVNITGDTKIWNQKIVIQKP